MGHAEFSPDGLHRYRLERDLGGPRIAAAFIGVNPSTATADTDDATIRKDMGFCKRHGWGYLIKGNLFSYRATDINVLKTVGFDANGPHNDYYLMQIMYDADVCIAAWGPTAKLPSQLRYRWHQIANLAWAMKVPLMCFGKAKDGQPLHTLMLSYDSPLQPWNPPE